MWHILRDISKTQNKKLNKRGYRDTIQQAIANEKQAGRTEMSHRLEHMWQQNVSPFFVKEDTDQKYDILFPKTNLLFSINRLGS